MREREYLIQVEGSDSNDIVTYLSARRFLPYLDNMYIEFRYDYVVCAFVMVLC